MVTKSPRFEYAAPHADPEDIDFVFGVARRAIQGDWGGAVILAHLAEELTRARHGEPPTDHAARVEKDAKSELLWD